MKTQNKGQWIVKVDKTFVQSKEISSNAKLLYIVLKSFTNNTTSEVYPSLKHLSDLSGIGRKTIQKSLKELKQKNLISIRQEKVNNKFSRNHYTLHEDEAEKIEFSVFSRRSKTTCDKTSNFPEGQFTAVQNVPKKIYNTNKIISFAHSFLFNEDQDITALSKVINKYKILLTENELRKILGYLYGKNKTFETINSFASYLQSCTKDSKKDNDFQLPQPKYKNPKFAKELELPKNNIKKTLSNCAFKFTRINNNERGTSHLISNNRFVYAKV